MAADKGRPKRSSDDLLDWFTVSYRSIYITLAVILLVGGAGGYYYWKRAQPVSPSPGDRVATAAATSARVQALDGSVQVKRSGVLEWVTARRDMVLNEGDLVRTGAGATAEIHFFNGTTFHMRAESLITIEEATEDPRSKSQRVTAALQSGVVNFQTAAGGSSDSATTIATPVSRTVAGVDAEGNITANQAGDSVKLFRGAATTETRSGERIALKPNEGVSVSTEGRAGPVVSLPDAPVLQAPPHDTEISYLDPSAATTLLAWRAVPGAARYHVMVDFSASFARPIWERTDWRQNSMELRGLEVGKYYWRVASVNANGVTGNFSEFARFAVTKPAGGSASAAPPALNIESLEPSGNILHLKGRTEPGASLTVNGQRVDVQVDGAFNEWLTLDKGGKQTIVIRATSVSGGVNEQTRPVVVAY
jgi:hypothetical protein